MAITMEPIGTVYTEAEKVPRHWTVSKTEGRLVIDKRFLKGLKDIQSGEQIVVIFHFHESPPFSSEYLVQTPAHKNKNMGVFSICSPKRPNPIGLSVLDVVSVDKNIIHVKRVDMMNGTPILDIKPNVKDDETNRQG